MSSLYYDLPPPKPKVDEKKNPSAPASPSMTPAANSSAPVGSAGWLSQASKLLPRGAVKPPPLPRTLIASLNKGKAPPPAAPATASGGTIIGSISSISALSTGAPSVSPLAGLRTPSSSTVAPGPGPADVTVPVASSDTPLDTLDDPAITNKYNPARPNDYEAFCVEREQRKKEEEMRARMEREAAEARKRARAVEESLAATARAAPKTLEHLNVSSGEEAYLRRLRMSQPGQGQGLGEPPLKKQRLSAYETPSPTRVLLLRNMVGPGEVDSELAGETADECAKYGHVTKCLVREIKAPAAPEDAVRIFVKFGEVAAAARAQSALAGRFFGGRTVKACFYDEQAFESGKLEG